MKPALIIIIDMQECMNTDAAGRRNNPHAAEVIADLLSTWRAAHAAVVHVRHLSRTPGSLFWPGQPGVEFQTLLSPLAHEHIVEKSVLDAFTHSGLERWLRDHGLDQVAIVGVSTNNSVEATARSAGNLGFKTYVASDATFAFEKHDYNGVLRSAEDVHAMALANLQGEYASVLLAAQIKDLL